MFITLATLSHGGKWDWMGHIFEMKGPTFEGVILCFVEMVVDKAQEMFLKNISDEITMYRLVLDFGRLHKYPFDRYKTYVTSKMASRPSRSHEEGKSIQWETKSVWV